MFCKFIITLFLFASISLFSSCSSNPYTGSLITNPGDTAGAAKSYSNFMKSAQSHNAVVTNTELGRAVSEVANDIIWAAEEWAKVNKGDWFLNNFNWEVNLVASNEANAWCMPGGKIVVYTGILDVAENADGLAAIIGHEVAHALLSHSYREKTAQDQAESTREIFGRLGISVKETGTTLPYSRAMETEADKIGLTLTVLAGYDGNEASKVWQRMTQFYGDNSAEEYLSTHPSGKRREKNLQKSLKKSEKIATRLYNEKKTYQFAGEKSFSAGAETAAGFYKTLDKPFDTDNIDLTLFVEWLWLGGKIHIPFKSDLLYGSFYTNYHFPIGTNGVGQWYPIAQLDFAKSYFGISFGVGTDIKIYERLFFRGEFDFKLWGLDNWQESYLGGGKFPMFNFMLGIGYAIR